MITLYFIVAGVSVLLWIPILLRFYKSWLGRHNPVSLAIFSAILLLVWSSVAGAWLVIGDLDAGIVVLVSAMMSSIVAVFSHVAFYWSDNKFSNQRMDD